MEKSFEITSPDSGKRIDVFLAGKLSVSRASVQKAIKSLLVTVNGKPEKTHYLLREHDIIAAKVPEEANAVSVEPSPMPLDILYEDPDIIVVNKKPGVVVHPGAGQSGNTLVGGLLYHTVLAELPDKTRRGIVHRLDKDTSGCIIAAKNDNAYLSLKEQFKKREVEKIYVALIHGALGRKRMIIDLPIERHPKNRKKMSVAGKEKGRAAVTELIELESVGSFSYIEARPRTGRTHQIRLHLSAIKHPVLGDRVYAGGRSVPPGVMRPQRQLLHALRLTITHPLSLKKMTFESPLPDDIKEVWKSILSLNI
jgi:23S rRNA pseudouridine1911/1915/1917 synthase